MKNCIIIHWCPTNIEKAMNPERRTYDKHWMPWTKNQLIEKWIPTETPIMPLPWAPIYEDYKKVLEKYDINENSILVGHSCGCAFLVRWLGESKKNISKLILVAPWKIPDENNEIKKSFYNFPIDETIKDRVKEIIMFTSNDEEDDWKESLKIFHKALGWKIIDLSNHGHYCLGDMWTEEFPELIEEILK